MNNQQKLLYKSCTRYVFRDLHKIMYIIWVPDVICMHEYMLSMYKRSNFSMKYLEARHKHMTTKIILIKSKSNEQQFLNKKFQSNKLTKLVFTIRTKE